MSEEKSAIPASKNTATNSYPAKKSHNKRASSSPVVPVNEISRDIRRDILNDDNQSFSVRKRRSETDDYSKDVEDTGDVEFGGISGVGVKKQKREDIGKPGSKVRRLKRMLQEAEKKKQRIEELKQQGGDGVKRAHAEQWSDIVKEVSGEKVFHDTSKLRKALKRKEKTKSKSAGEWKVSWLTWLCFLLVLNVTILRSVWTSYRYRKRRS